MAQRVAIIFSLPGPVRAVLRRFPGLQLIVAHMGMPEYREFLDICADYDKVRLDTTMAFTAFIDETMPFPASELPRLRDLGDKILFGSDFPNIPHTYPDALTAITEIDGVDDVWLRNVLMTMLPPSSELSTLKAGVDAR